MLIRLAIRAACAGLLLGISVGGILAACDATPTPPPACGPRCTPDPGRAYRIVLPAVLQDRRIGWRDVGGAAEYPGPTEGPGAGIETAEPDEGGVYP